MALIKFQYSTEKEKEEIINSNIHLYLCEQQNLFEGTFLIFSDEPLPIIPYYSNVEVEELKQENILLKAQNQALTDRTDFHEDLIAEMAMLVYE
jgi:hypothetical protein